MRLIALKGMRSVNGLHFTPDGRRLLAVGGYEVRSIDEARWVDIGEGKETLRVPLNASCYAVTPDLTRMAVGNSSLWRQEGFPVPPVLTFDPTDPTWHKDDSRLREVNAGLLSPANTVTVTALAFDLGCEHLAIVSQEFWGGRASSPATRYLHLAAMNDGGRPTVRTIGHNPTAVVFSPDGRAIATGYSDKRSDQVEIWNTATLTGRLSFTTAAGVVLRLCYSRDGTLIAAVNAKAVSLLLSDWGIARHTLAHPKQVNAVAFTPDGHRLLTTSTDKLVRIWDAATGQLLTSYDFGVGGTNAVAVAPDGLTAAVSGARGKVVLFDLDG